MTPEPAFGLFGIAHVATLAIIAGACFGVRPAVVRVLRPRWLPHAAWALVVVLIVNEIARIALYVGVQRLPWIDFLPLHLCDLNALLCAFMVARRSYRVYEVAYFWAVGGSVAAMLTPDLQHGFPHPIFVQFFFGHALNVVSVLFATFAYSFRPELRSVGKTLLVTAFYAAAIMPLNFALGTNYLYLRHKPSAPSVLDHFGPWPWYLLGLIALSVFVCLACYAPFALAARKRARRLRGTDVTH